MAAVTAYNFVSSLPGCAVILSSDHLTLKTKRSAISSWSVHFPNNLAKHQSRQLPAISFTERADFNKHKRSGILLAAV